MKSSRANSCSTHCRRTAWLWIESILLIAGLGLLATFGVFRIESVISSKTALRDFAEAKLIDAPGDEPKESRRDTVTASAQNAHAKFPATRVASDPRTPLAVLQIPRIHLVAPLLDGTDAWTLRRALGRIAGTAWPGEDGNVGIAGHRDSFFRRLKDVAVGDAIELRTPTGTKNYTVNRIRIVVPSDVSVLKPQPRPSLTLVTCYRFRFVGSAPLRYIVTASLTQPTESGSEKSDARPFSQP